MSIELSPLTVNYSGPPVKVDARRITREMRVPNLGRDDPMQADERPADVATHLFEQAKDAGALVIPAGLRAACYADNDALGGGFILVVYVTHGSPVGVTCGWRDVENIVRCAGDSRADNDRRVVKEALQLMAGEMNAAFHIDRQRSAES